MQTMVSEGSTSGSDKSGTTSPTLANEKALRSNVQGYSLKAAQGENTQAPAVAILQTCHGPDKWDNNQAGQALRTL